MEGREWFSTLQGEFSPASKKGIAMTKTTAKTTVADLTAQIGKMAESNKKAPAKKAVAKAPAKPAKAPAKKAPAKAPAKVVAKAPAKAIAKAPAKKAPALKVDAKAIEEGKKLSANETQVLKTLSTSDFRETDAVTSAIPSYTLPLTLPTSIAAKSVPGLVASLNKKGMLTTAKVKGVTMITLTAEGAAVATA